MKNKSSKKKTSGIKPISEAHYGIVLEDIRSTVKLVLEGHVALDKKIDNFKEEFIEFKDEMYVFRDEMYRFKNDTEKSFKTIAQYLSIIDDEIKSIKKELDKKAYIREVVDLKSRIIAIENEVLSLRKLVLQR